MNFVPFLFKRQRVILQRSRTSVLENSILWGKSLPVQSARIILPAKRQGWYKKNGEKEEDTVEYVILIINSHRGYLNRSLLNVTVFWLISHLELSDHGHTIKLSQPPNHGDHRVTTSELQSEQFLACANPWTVTGKTRLVQIRTLQNFFQQ